MVTSLHHISNRWEIKICLRVKCQALLTFPWEALLRSGWGGAVEGRGSRKIDRDTACPAENHRAQRESVSQCVRQSKACALGRKVRGPGQTKAERRSFLG